MRKAKCRAEPLDRHIGERLRAARQSKRLSQSDLALELGVTFQQVQKYESSANRISASMLYRAAAAVGQDIGYFFEGALIK